MGEQQPVIDPGSDNRGVVQAALDEAHGRGGGTVVLPNGRCPLGGPLQLRSNVTLRGTGMITTILCPTAGSSGAPLLTATDPLAGATVEDLTVAGLDPSADADPAASGARPAIGAAIAIGAGASFVFLRRLRLVDLPGAALRVGGGAVDHLYLEQIVIEGCAGDGIVLDPVGEAEAVFLTEVSVRSFGRRGPAGTAGIRSSARAFISQLHVQPVEAGATGLLLEAGSDHAVASNLFFGVSGGEPWVAASGVRGVEVEAVLIRDLLDARLARVFP